MTRTEVRGGLDRWLVPPVVPVAFWEHPPLVEALASGHMGRVLRAYRSHPWHGRAALAQELVGGWLGLAQSRMSKIENGPASQNLDWLRFVARTLRIPAEHLWFALEAGTPVAAVRQSRSDEPGHNELLRAARLRVPSPAYAELRMSRRELADAVNAYLADRKLAPVYLDHKYVGKLERGVVRWPRAGLRRALRAVLGVSTDAALGFYVLRRDADEPAPGVAALDGVAPDHSAAPPTSAALPVRVLAPQEGTAVALTIQIGDREPIKITLDGLAADDDGAAAASHSGADAVVYSLAQARRVRRRRPA